MWRRLLGTSATVAGVALLLAIVAFVGKAWYDSRIPATYSVMDYGLVDDGGGAPLDPHAAHEGGLSVAELHGPGGTPNARFELTANEATIRLGSSRTVDA